MYLCGGADQKLLTESKFSKYKPFIPKETVSDKANTLYRVISPISNGYDSYQLVNKILTF